MGADIIAGLDMGTSKICAVIAERKKGMRILGIGIAPATGIRKGMITSIEETVRAIREAMDQAESASGTRIRSVTAGISGSHIKGFYSSGVVGVRGREVSRKDIERAVDSAKAMYIPLDREVLHVIPTEFILDEQDGITDPEGMCGVRLEARVYIVTGSVSAMQNLSKCCRKAELEVDEIVIKPLASAAAVLNKDEMEYGVIYVDIGGGTTDIALFRDRALRHVSVLGVGGAHLTSDIAIGLRVGINEAEQLKKTSGAAFMGMIQESEEIKFSHAGQERTLPRKYLIEIMQPRCEEMLEMIKKEIQSCGGYEVAPCGVVLTGGISLLAGFDKMAETVLGLPVRIGNPGMINGLKPSESGPAFATGIGLAIHALSASSGAFTYPDISGLRERFTDAVRDVMRYISFPNIQNKKEGGVVCLKSRK